MSNAFSTWIDTFVEEKGLDIEDVFTIETNDFWGEHFIPLEVVLWNAKENASPAEQAKIKDILVRIDFANGSVMHFFEHLARGLAESFGKVA